MSKYAARRLANKLQIEGRVPPRNVRGGHTRARLIEAAQELFFKSDYFTVSVDELVKRAELSRAVFYLHFPSKDALLVEVMRAESRKLDPLYRYFEKKRVSRASVRRFVSLTVRLGEKARHQISLMSLASSYSPAILNTFAENRARHMDMLGEALPAFRNLGRGAAIERRRSSRSMLLFYQIEQLTVQASFAAEAIDVESLIDTLTDQLYAFISEYDTPAKPSAPKRAIKFKEA